MVLDVITSPQIEGKEGSRYHCVRLEAEFASTEEMDLFQVHRKKFLEKLNKSLKSTGLVFSGEKILGQKLISEAPSKKEKKKSKKSAAAKSLTTLFIFSREMEKFVVTEEKCKRTK